MFNRFKTNSASGVSGFLIQNGGLFTYLILAVALVGFEMFNFSTTQYALGDLLGELKFFGIQWATILAIAFCGIDFAGIGRLFLPDGNDDTGRETWFLFGAWLLAATMNALLTWWGVSMALSDHPLQSTEIMDPKLLMDAVPVFVAAMVWVTRVLLIGSFAMAGRRVQVSANQYSTQRASSRFRPTQSAAPQQLRNSVPSQPVSSSSLPARRPAPLPMISPMPSVQPRSTQPAPLEPEYISDGDVPGTSSTSIPALRPLALSARPAQSSGSQDRNFK